MNNNSNKNELQTKILRPMLMTMFLIFMFFLTINWALHIKSINYHYLLN
jgi:hypothetical protein